jgi:hypothetical protein
VSRRPSLLRRFATSAKARARDRVIAVSRRAPTLLLFLIPSFAACDRSSEYAACVYADDPASASGSRDSACPESVFWSVDGRWAQLNGTVRRGEDGVPNAIVSVEPSPGLVTYAKDAPKRSVSNAVGLYGPLRNVAHRYDMTVKLETDVMVFRGVVSPFFDPNIESNTSTPARGWRSTLEVQTEAPVPADHALAFFASKTDALTVEGDVEHGVSLICSTFDASATIHAVEYVRGQDLSSAVGYAKADVAVSAGGTRIVRFRLEPITRFGETRIKVAPPSGFDVPSSVDVLMAYSRTSGALLTTMQPGVVKKLPLIPDVSSYGYRVRAARPDGAISQSGEGGVDALSKENLVSLIEPPIARSPAAGATVGLDEPFMVTGAGVLEHIFVPEGGGSTIRIITTDGDARLPTFGSVGATPPVGKWSWSVRSYPKVHSVKDFTSLSRRYESFGASEPRVITFR